MKFIALSIVLIYSVFLHGQYPCLDPKSDSIIVTDNAQVPLGSASNLLSISGNKGFSLPLRPDGKNIPLFSSAGLWIGGKDAAGNLKVAATIKDKNHKRDFFPGPLEDNGQPNYTDCTDYDRLFTVSGKEILEHLSRFRKLKSQGKQYPSDSIPKGVRDWPAIGNPYFGKNIIPEWLHKNEPKIPYFGANFHDEDNDNLYNPSNGDYPIVRNFGCPSPSTPVPEVIYFWIFNDNTRHKITGGEAIQMQVNAYAYKYKSADEAYDCFYFSYQLYNIADSDIRDAYVALFIDPSIGCPLDDKVAFDTLRNTVLLYNGNKYDNSENLCSNNTSLGYYPYTIAIDYKNSMRLPKVFLKDDNGHFLHNKYGSKIYADPMPGTGDIDTIVNGGVSSFIVLDDCHTGEDEDCNLLFRDQDVYSLLRGKKYTGEEYLHNEVPIKKMFTGNPSQSDTWSMITDSTYYKKNISCLMSVGPFLLQPGQVNWFDFSVSLKPMIKDIPDFEEVGFNQPLIDSKYYYLDIDESGLGFKHTRLNFETLANESKIHIEIEKNPYVENLKEWALSENLLIDSLAENGYYKFEGYNVYQVKEPQGKFDNDNYKLIMQCDLENNFDKLYNFFPETFPSAENKVNRTWVRKLMVSGKNKGLNYSVDVDKDYFAKPGEDALINGKTYYYAVQPYNVNNWKTADPVAGYGQRAQFWAPHPLVFSHYYVNKSAQKKVTFECKNGTIQLNNLQAEDIVNIYSNDGNLLRKYNHKSQDDSAILWIDTHMSVLIIDIINESQKRKNSYKIVCF